jgi:hypothetical protein
MFSSEVKSLLEKVNYVISELRCMLQDNFGDVFTVVYNQVYEEVE